MDATGYGADFSSPGMENFRFGYLELDVDETVIFAPFRSKPALAVVVVINWRSRSRRCLKMAGRGSRLSLRAR